MQVSQILSLDCTHNAISSTSKKRILEQISEIASPKLNISKQDIFESLLAREKMGSTGIGEGIAIPHGRIHSDARATAVLLTLESAIDFDSLDSKPVDIVFALLVPEDQCKQHLETLSEVSKKLGDSKIRAQIRRSQNDEQLFSALLDA